MIPAIVKSLNIGCAKEHNFFGTHITSGICKAPVHHAVHLSFTGFEGDGIFNTKHHGGVDKAICVYPETHLNHWQQILGIALPQAPFGENISLSGLTEKDVHIGDIFAIGTSLVQVSQPRQPCKTLTLRYNLPTFVKLVVDSGFTGWYLKVLEEGLIKEGDTCMLMTPDPGKVSIAFANQIMHHDRKNRKGIEKILKVQALSSSWQESLQQLLSKC